MVSDFGYMVEEERLNQENNKKSYYNGEKIKREHLYVIRKLVMHKVLYLKDTNKHSNNDEEFTASGGWLEELMK